MKHPSILFLALMFTVWSCNSIGQSSQISCEDFKGKLTKVESPQLIDVRTPDEFTGGHLEGAVNIDFYEPDFAEKVKALNKNEPVFVYCHIGGRSADAAALLKKQGFTEIYDLSRGIVGWKEKGYPLVK